MGVLLCGSVAPSKPLRDFWKPPDPLKEFPKPVIEFLGGASPTFGFLGVATWQGPSVIARTASTLPATRLALSRTPRPVSRDHSMIAPCPGRIVEAQRNIAWALSNFDRASTKSHFVRAVVHIALATVHSASTKFHPASTISHSASTNFHFVRAKFDCAEAKLCGASANNSHRHLRDDNRSSSTITTLQRLSAARRWTVPSLQTSPLGLGRSPYHVRL